MMSLVSYTIIFIGIYILIWFISYLKQKEIKTLMKSLSNLILIINKTPLLLVVDLLIREALSFYLTFKYLTISLFTA